MQRLKRFGAIGGAIMLAACWPLAVGQIAQSVLNNSIASLQSSNFSTQIVSYDRRYLSATATTKITVDNPQLKEHLTNNKLPTTFLVQHDIEHGLLQVTAQSSFIDFDIVPAVLNTQTLLNGNTEFELLINNINYPIPNSDSASVYLAKSKISGEATVLGEVDLLFSLPSVQLRFDNDEIVTLSSVSGSIKGKKAAGFWHGEQQLQLDKIELVSTKGFFSVLDFNYQLASIVDDSTARVNSNHVVKAASIVSSDLTELKDVHFDITLGNLDVESFGDLLKTYQATTVLDEAALVQSIAMVDQLFNKGFQLSLNQLKLTQGEGELQAEWALEVPPGINNITQNFSQIIAVLAGKLDSYASKELLYMYPFMRQRFDDLVSMELMQLTDSGYRMNVSLSDGVLTFANGKKMPLMTFLMLNASKE